MSEHPGVDPDRVETWPSSVVRFVQQISEDADPEANPFLTEEDRRLRLLLGSSGLAAYHATRLLPHEVDGIRRQGLRQLDEQLINERLVSAANAGELSAQQADALLNGHALRDEGGGSRGGQICLILGRAAFDTHPQRVNPLLRTWGGESINFTQAGNDLSARLNAVGRPTLVAVELPLSPAAVFEVFPSMSSVFIGSYTGVPASASVFWRSGSLRGENIRAISGPGDPDYDRYPRLVRR